MKHRRPYLPVAMLERREKRLQMREDRLTGKVAQKIIFDDMAFADQSATIAAQAAEIVRLRALVEDAYFEGSDDSVHGYGRDWLGSKSAAALQPKEGE